MQAPYRYSSAAEDLRLSVTCTFHMQTNHTSELFPFYSISNKLATIGVEVKVNYPIKSLDRALGLYKVEAPRVSRHEKYDVNCAARGAG
jgi:hypothetical protein